MGDVVGCGASRALVHHWSNTNPMKKGEKFKGRVVSRGKPISSQARGGTGPSPHHPTTGVRRCLQHHLTWGMSVACSD
jgi:hypothetical protein